MVLSEDFGLDFVIGCHSRLTHHQLAGTGLQKISSHSPSTEWQGPGTELRRPGQLATTQTKLSLMDLIPHLESASSRLLATGIVGAVLASVMMFGLFGRKNHMPVEGRVSSVSQSQSTTRSLTH